MASFFLVPPFSDTQPRYDMHTFKGRAWHFYRATNPLLVLETDSSIDLHRKRVAEFTTMRNQGKSRSSLKYSDTDLWYSRSVLEGCVHPTTQQNIFPLFRFAAFAPLNLLIVPIMLSPKTIASKKLTLGVHICNQSVNAVVNYSNRSSEDVGLDKLFFAYIGAVVSSCTFALSASHIMSKIKDANSFKATLVRSTLPFAACVAAGISNLALMRSEEWYGKGVEVRAAVGPVEDPSNDDNKGESLGFSQKAGVKSIAYCSGTRVALNVLVMTVPPLFMAWLLRYPFVRGNKVISFWSELFVINAMTMGAVPPCLGLMKPVVTVPVTELEEEFHNRRDSNGNVVTHVTMYKGL